MEEEEVGDLETAVTHEQKADVIRQYIKEVLPSMLSITAAPHKNIRGDLIGLHLFITVDGIQQSNGGTYIDLTDLSNKLTTFPGSMWATPASGSSSGLSKALISPPISQEDIPF